MESPCMNCHRQRYRRIPEISLRAYNFQRPFWGTSFWRGLSTEGNLRFKIDWASLIVGSKFTVFALFYFVFEDNFPSTSPRVAYIWRGDLTEGFLRYWFEGLIFGGVYFRNFTVFSCLINCFTELWIHEESFNFQQRLYSKPLTPRSC